MPFDYELVTLPEGEPDWAAARAHAATLTEVEEDEVDAEQLLADLDTLEAAWKHGHPQALNLIRVGSCRVLMAVRDAAYGEDGSLEQPDLLEAIHNLEEGDVLAHAGFTQDYTTK